MVELDDLNPEQRRAVLHDAGPLLVVAGAGTGKTAVITRRIAHLIDTGKAAPDQILALTFTDKSAREMEERVDANLPMGVLDVNVLTFNSFGDQLLKQYGLDIGLPLGLKLISRTQQVLLLKDHLDELKLDYFATHGSPTSLFREWLGLFSSLRNEMISPEQYAEYTDKLSERASDSAERLEARKQQELAHAYGAYTRLKKQKGYIDYDDQIYLAIELLSSRDNVLAELRNQYRYIMVDEFQDTNFAQSRMLELLAGENGNLMVVGDDDQSIYKFRGAAISNILAFSERFPSADRIVLTQNYRSNQQILDAAYQLIQHNNPDRLEAKYGFDKHLKAQTDGMSPQLSQHSNRSIEADWLAADIAARLKAGTEPRDIAVLVRKRKQMEVLMPALQRYSVPAAYATSQKLYHQPEIEFVLYFLQYIARPSASECLYHLLEHEMFRVDLHYLAFAAHKSKMLHIDLDEYLRTETSGSDETDIKLQKFFEQVSAWRLYAAEHRVSETAYEILSSSGYLERLEERADDDPNIALVYRNLERYMRNLTEYQEVAEDPSVYGYVASLGNTRELGDDDAYQEPDLSAQEVRVMTIHQSKGLEFDTVYLYDMSQSAFPGARRASGLTVADELLSGEVLPEGDWHLQEERRLMYVAMTRAKAHLIMTYSPNHGGKTLRKPSIFLSESLGEIPAVTAAADTSVAALDSYKPLPAVQVLLEERLFDDQGRLRLTPHQIDDYDSCPYNFRYKYLLNVPEPPSPMAMFGTVLHKIVQEYYILAGRGDVKLTDLEDMLQQLWEPVGFDSAGHERQRYELAKQTLARFFEREQSKNQPPLYSEKAIEVELSDINLVIRGRMDAVFELPDGRLEIRDYKTGLTDDQTRADAKAKNSLQLRIYAMAWEMMTGKAPDRVVLDFLVSGVEGEAVLSSKILGNTRDKIAGVVEGIRAGNFEPGSNHLYCSHRPLSIDREVIHA